VTMLSGREFQSQKSWEHLTIVISSDPINSLLAREEAPQPHTGNSNAGYRHQMTVEYYG